MKIKAYFVTYRNNEELEKMLTSFMGSGIQNYDYEVFIVNNSPEYPIKHEILIRLPSFKCTIINNNTRPSNSTGHLARNWNECLIDGFKDVENPDCDIVMLSQNDNDFLPDTMDKLIESHQKYSFIQNGHGDSFHSYTVDAIRKVGLWDERFCNIGYQEADYLLRQMLYNSKGCSINDRMHERIHNPLGYDLVNYEKGSGWSRVDEHHIASAKHHKVSEKVFNLKWPYIESNAWTDKTAKRARLHGKNKQFIMYPYFEDKICPNPNYIKYG